MGFSNYSPFEKCGSRQEFECECASALELIHVGVSAAVHRGLPMTSTTLSAMGAGGGASGTRLDSGTAGGWPLRTGPGWVRSYGGPRGLSVGGGSGGGRRGDHAARVPAVLLVHVSGGAPYSVQFQSTGGSSCMLLGTVMVLDVPVNRSDKLQQFIFVVGANCAGNRRVFTGDVRRYSSCGTLGSTMDT